MINPFCRKKYVEAITVAFYCVPYKEESFVSTSKRGTARICKLNGILANAEAQPFGITA